MLIGITYYVSSREGFVEANVVRTQLALCELADEKPAFKIFLWPFKAKV